MYLGFIGTGEISKAVILGILKSKIKYKKIFISKRNFKISRYLKKKNIVISFISTIKLNDLKKYIKTKCQIVRVIPLPPISLGVGPIPIYPPNKTVKNFFDKIGETIEIKNEELSLNFWTMSSMMAPYYEMLNKLSNWLVAKGLNKSKAENYITSLFLGLSKNANQNNYKDLTELVKKSQTPEV